MPPHVLAAGRAPSPPPTPPPRLPVGVDGNVPEVAGRVPEVAVLGALDLFLVGGAAAAAEFKGLVGGKGEGEGEGVVKV